ncbi:prepilin-type N-terminal cleavage/methylation domain-containing protein [Moraxella nasibovis]|uniref:type IV pilus modification PilV family protein n=1 Tax=Moraxella nasibovis TaxID=2904120 RepID=UPI00240F29D0|nr:prepilin-type N-terminal cleavage/methylation domain-containing protein [Moraxella nasibovis]WFF38205.1 prepilin-type N-terminal cleavage/methylation domain-containing protein [Moraxella nasibovis]
MKRHQQGFGLIEVMVALLLVTMAFLGFLMVQARATHATKDAAMRTSAVAYMTTHAEILSGADDESRRDHARLFGRMNQADGTSMQMMEGYRQALQAVSTDCHQSQCTTQRLITHRAINNARLAAKEGIRLNAVVHNGEHRLIAAWGETAATWGEGGCLYFNGSINQGARCMTMAY